MTDDATIEIEEARGCSDPGDSVDYCSVCVRRPAARASTVCEDCARGDIA